VTRTNLIVGGLYSLVLFAVVMELWARYIHLLYPLPALYQGMWLK
jgi:hypothetical protein